MNPKFKISTFIEVTILCNFLIFGISPLVGSDGQQDTTISTLLIYLSLAISLFVFSFFALVTVNKIRIKINLFDALPLVFLTLWLYGFILGYFNGHPKESLLRNFAGATVFLFYYVFLYAKPKKERIVNLFYFLIIISCLLAPVSLIRFGKEIILNQKLLVTQLNTFASAGILLAIYGILKGQIIKNVIILFMCFAVAYLFTLSRGIMLGVFFFVPVILFSSIIRNAKLLLLAVFILFLSGLTIIYSNTVFKKNIISEQINDGGNKERAKQISAIFKEFSILGRGHGAPISNYKRGNYSKSMASLTENIDTSYGVEVSYFNMLHKYGIFAILPFSIYFFLIAKIVFLIITKDRVEHVLFGGILIYLFRAVGNPCIFNPAFVFCHCLVMYCIREEK